MSKHHACHFSSYYIVPRTNHRTGHHRSVEGVIYKEDSSHPNFYLRPTNITNQFLDWSWKEDGERLKFGWNVNNIGNYNVTDFSNAHLEAHYDY